MVPEPDVCRPLSMSISYERSGWNVSDASRDRFRIVVVEALSLIEILTVRMSPIFAARGSRKRLAD